MCHWADPNGILQNVDEKHLLFINEELKALDAQGNKISVWSFPIALQGGTWVVIDVIMERRAT